jgi:hypothetical protein
MLWRREKSLNPVRNRTRILSVLPVVYTWVIQAVISGRDFHRYVIRCSIVTHCSPWGAQFHYMCMLRVWEVFERRFVWLNGVDVQRLHSVSEGQGCNTDRSIGTSRLLRNSIILFWKLLTPGVSLRDLEWIATRGQNNDRLSTLRLI